MRKNNKIYLITKFNDFLEKNDEPLKFIGMAIFIFALLQIVYFKLYIGSEFFFKYLQYCASLSKDILVLIGEPVRLSSRVISHEAGPSVTVVEGCDALRIFSVLVAAILAYNGSFIQKLIGIIFGISFLFGFNLLRISSLLWIDVYYSDLFDMFHHVILPFLLWLIALTYFYCWGRVIDK